jgi:quercetin dioxygenase-like cupin family protein
VIAPLAPEGSQIATYKVTYPPASTPPEPRVHDGYEWLYVLSGRLRLILGDQDLILTRGEAAEFDTRVPHSMSATGSRPAQVLSIFNNDGVRMHTHTTDEDHLDPVTEPSRVNGHRPRSDQRGHH